MADRTPRPLDPEIDPWERQPREGSKAWEAFVNYRDEGPGRSLRKTARALGKHYTMIDRWAAQWQWSLRIRAHDKDVDDKSRAGLVQRIVEYRARAAEQMIRKAQILSLIDGAVAQRINKNREELAAMKMEALMNLAIRAGAVLPGILKAEALALGDVTERQEIATEDDSVMRGIRDNAEARSHLAAALQQLGTGQSAAGGTGDAGEPGEVEERAAPDLSESDPD